MESVFEYEKVTYVSFCGFQNASYLRVVDHVVDHYQVRINVDLLDLERSDQGIGPRGK